MFQIERTTKNFITMKSIKKRIYKIKEYVQRRDLVKIKDALFFFLNG